MKISSATTSGAYSAVITAALCYMFIAAAAPAQRTAKFDSIDVGRINVREPDGTIRMIISNSAEAPGIIVKNHEYPHPNRRSAGMVFYNDEGTENGGLTFAGTDRNGKRSSDEGLTFDRYEQDQVVQMAAEEEGSDRAAGLNVFDRPDRPMDFAMLSKVAAASPDKQAALAEKAHIGGNPRLFVGRNTDGAARVALRDSDGRKRLVMSVAANGAARIDFLDAAGKVTKSITPR